MKKVGTPTKKILLASSQPRKYPAYKGPETSGLHRLLLELIGQGPTASDWGEKNVRRINELIEGKKSYQNNDGEDGP